jgi:hypothetical protein
MQQQEWAKFPSNVKLAVGATPDADIFEDIAQ